MRCFVPILLFCATTAHASAGLEVLAIYRCDALPMITEQVKGCSARFPHLAQQADAALAGWRRLNETAAKQASTECLADMQKIAATEGAERADKIRARIKEVKADMLKRSAAEMEEDGEAFCLKSFKQIGERKDRAFDL